MPPRDKFVYSFDNLAKVIDEFTVKVGLSKFTLYVQDYGAPIGFRIAQAHPERIRGLVIQNGNAYEEGLREFWKPHQGVLGGPLAEESPGPGRVAERSTPSSGSTPTACATRRLISPDNWLHDSALLEPPREQGHPARPVPSYGIESAALSQVAGILPHAPAARR